MIIEKGEVVGVDGSGNVKFTYKNPGDYFGEIPILYKDKT